MNRLFLVLAGLAGAAGVAFAAASAHLAGGPFAASAALVLLGHAPALLVLGLTLPPKPLLLAGLVVAAGAALFSADMAMRLLAARALLPMAAPAGGMLMIAGWLLLAVSALFVRRT